MKFKNRDVVFVGNRRRQGLNVIVKQGGRSLKALPHKVHHSPIGFESGYGGSGPADLALSILSYVIDEQPTVAIYRGKVGQGAWLLHQAYKTAIISALPQNVDWQIRARDVIAWIEQYEKMKG